MDGRSDEMTGNMYVDPRMVNQFVCQRYIERDSYAGNFSLSGQVNGDDDDLAEYSQLGIYSTGT